MKTPTRLRKSLRPAVALALAILAALGLLIVLSQQPSKPQSVSSALRVEKPSGASDPGNQLANGSNRSATLIAKHPGKEPRYLPGEVLHYRLVSQHVTTSVVHPPAGAAAQAEAPLSSACTLEGSVRIKIYREDDAGWTAGFELADLRAFVTTSQGAPPPTDRAIAALSTEALAVIDRSGRIGRIRFQPGVVEEARDQIKAIIARLQVVLPEDTALREWTAEEEDPTGRALVRYRRVAKKDREADESGAKLSKRKEKYLATFQSGALDLAQSLEVGGETTIVLDREAPAHLSGQESLKIDVPGLFDPVEVEEEFTIDLVSRSIEPDLAVLGLRRLLITLEEEESTLAPQWHRPHAGDRKIDLAAELALAEQLFTAGSQSSSEAVECFQRIVEALEQDPASAARVLDSLRERKENAPLWANLLGALASAGTEAAQSALGDVVSGDDWPPQMRESALLALAHVEKPIESLDGLLESLHGGQGALSVNALLVLGAVGDRVRGASPERFRGIEDYVVAAGLDAANPALLPASLEAVGNLGPSRTPRTVLNAYRSGEEPVRMSAVRAVRKIGDRSAEELLRSALFNDPSEDVRVAAAAVMAERQGGAEALRQAAVHDASESVRRRALREMAPSLAGDAESRRTVELVARNDPSVDVRSEAQRLLGGTASQ